MQGTVPNPRLLHVMARLSRPWRLALLVAAVPIAAFLLAALAVRLFVDADAYKPRLAAFASDALGLEASIEGDVKVGLLRGLHVTLGKVRLRNGGVDLVFAEEADLAIDVLPLLRRQLRFGGITLHHARITLERGTDGRYNFQRPAGAPVAFRALDLPRLSLPDASLAYADRGTGFAFESARCTGELADLRHPGAAPFLAKLSAHGTFACEALRGKDATVTDLAVTLKATDGLFDFAPVTLKALGGQGSGSLRMDRTGAVPALALAFSLAGLRIEQYFPARAAKGLSVRGAMDFATTLAMRGHTRLELRRSAEGSMSLSGRNLVLDGADLDGQLDRFESSQNFNALDLAAVLLAGPAGLAVTKGFEFTAIAGEAGGSTPIHTVVSTWKVTRGIAQASDVALATGAHRLALRGGLDFVDEEFDEVFVYAVDAQGCALAKRRIRGPFARPVLEKADLLASAAGPLANLLGKARALLPGAGQACERVYGGSVAAPR